MPRGQNLPRYPMAGNGAFGAGGSAGFQKGLDKAEFLVYNHSITYGLINTVQPIKGCDEESSDGEVPREPGRVRAGSGTVCEDHFRAAPPKDGFP